MPLKPHPTDPDKMVYVSRQYDIDWLRPRAKAEGEPLYTEEELSTRKGQVETVYVERRVPAQLENQAHKLIDSMLRVNGYDPEEI